MVSASGKKLTMICSGVLPRRVFEDNKKFLNSSKKDYVSQGYEPNCQGNGVLMHWDNIPLAYYGVPTANMMIYSESLWDKILSNETLNQLIETKSFWMENDHKDSAEVLISNIAGRITNWEKGPNNLIIGGVDIMDTPQGHITYSCAQTGSIGTSTRGFGVLDDIGKGLTSVNEDEYVHVDSDFVTVPAVSVSRVQIGEDPIKESVLAEDSKLRALVMNAFERNPDNFELLKLANICEHGKYDNDVNRHLVRQRLAASLKRK